MHRKNRLVYIITALALLLALLPGAKPTQAKPEALLVTDASVSMLADINPGSADGIYYDETNKIAAPLGNNVVFLANSPAYGMEPWITNGTPVGTKMIKDTFPGPTGVYGPTHNNSQVSPVTWKGKVFFVGQGKDPNGIVIPQLWVTNGTAEGTAAVLPDPLPITEFVVGTQAVMFLTKFYDPATQITESSVWWTDGTPQGTRMLFYLYNKATLHNIHPLGRYAFFITPQRTLLRIDSANSQNAVVLAENMFDVWGAVNGLLFFSREDSSNGQELWQTDGTVAGTVMVADLSPAGSSTYIHEALVYGSKLAFIATVGLGDGGWVTGVFTTTGKAGGITMIDSTKFGDFRNLQQQGDMLFYRRSPTYQPGYVVWQLWYSTGPMATKQVCPTCLFNPDIGIGGLPGEIIFSADDSGGRELWYSDFTDENTRRISGVYGSSSSSASANFVSMDGYVFFTAKSKEKGREPYIYRKVSSPIAARLDKFEAMPGVVHKFDVLANDSHQTGLPLKLASFDERGRYGGYVSRDDRGTPNDRTDDRLIYQLSYNADNEVDELHYWVEDTAGNRMSGRVSIDIVPLKPMPPDDIKYNPHIQLRENLPVFTLIGQLEVSDPSPYEYSHTCKSNTPDSPITTIGDNGLYVNGPIDYETHPDDYVISVTCTDPTNLSYTEEIRIPVINENEQPELTFPVDPTVVEDSPSQQWQIGISDPENNANSVTVSAENGTASVTDCTVSACVLHYQPAPNFVGTDTLTFKATDSGDLFTEGVMSVTVTTGNDDPPLMKPIATIIRYNRIQEHQFPLSGIAAGPYEEEPVTVRATTDNPAMLADLTVDYTSGPTGTLRFTLHPEEGREALVTITLSDGVNETQYTFNVLVTDNPPLYIPMLGR